MRVRDLRRKSRKRIDADYLSLLNIQSYGEDNLYPQTLHNIIAASATGSECMDRYADFIEGNGLKDHAFSAKVINRKGQTVDDIHSLICRDLAEYSGIALHVNYNIYGQIVEVQHVPFENCRLTEEDADGYVSKIAVHPDWSGKKTRNGKVLRVNKSTVDYIDVFNPNADVIQSQIDKAGGIEFYKGQILWLSMCGSGIYPIGKSDRVVTEMSTDEGLANVKYRNARNNFLPAGMVITKKGQSAPDEDNGPFSDDTGFSNTLSKLQGDTNCGKIVEVEVDSEEEEPKFVSFVSQNYDKEFTATESSIVERIYSAFGQEPWHCIRIGKVGFSGDILTDAFDYYNSVVSKEQRFIERALKKVFSVWYEPNITTDFSIEPIKYVKYANI